MITREQFGDYLLLKKLAEDPLGETFRAGRLGPQGMEQVVLLRVFNGSALEGQDLWSKIADRREVQTTLRSPNLGNGIDLGEVQSVPYVAYDYISGKNLATVFQQVLKGNHPVPVEHALLIAERIALGLSVAYETRVLGQRVLHGFLVPQLVVLSNEGENRLLGFEAGAGLRQLATTGPARQAFTTYLSPETLYGEAPASTDDVYSLGAILLELLLSRPLPKPEQHSYDRLIQEITDRGLPEVGYLLNRSLCAASDRLGDVVAWHKALSKILIDGKYRATTFNLAFFMHNLFRDEIEKETQEIELERTIRVEAPPPASKPETPTPTATTPSRSLQTAAIQARARARRRSSSRPLLVAAAVVATLALGGGAYFTWDRFLAPDGAATPETTTASASPTELSLASGGGAETAPADYIVADVVATPDGVLEGEEEEGGPTEDELREQIDTIIAERTQSMERSLRAQYDSEIAALRTQLEAAQEKAAERERLAAEAAEAVARAEREAREREAAEKAAAAARAPKPIATPSTTQRAASDLPRPATSPPVTTPQPVAEPAAGTSTPAASPDRPAPARSTPQPRPVRRGDLVPLGAGVVPPKLTGRLQPRYPMMAQKVKKEASVLLTVLVDENGKVQEVRMPDEKVGFGFEDAAAQAARRAHFDPAIKDGVAVKTWTSIRIEFRLK